MVVVISVMVQMARCPSSKVKSCSARSGILEQRMKAVTPALFWMTKGQPRCITDALHGGCWV